MPELPEVETVVRGLKPLEGQTLKRLNIFDTKVWFESEVSPEAFEGRVLRAISRRGKYIVFRFDDLALVQHLRMTGKMLDSHSDAIPAAVRNQIGTKGEKAKQIRSRFCFTASELVFFDTRRFGTLTAVKDEEKFFQNKRIAPDPISDPEKALQWFKEKLPGNRAVKAVLLDQSVVAGVGNIYADEALFELGYHPLMTAGRVKRTEDLWRSIQNLFQSAIRSGGSSVVNYVGADGKRGTYASELKVYGRGGEACLRCGEKILTMQVAGRTSHYCRICQKKSDHFK